MTGFEIYYCPQQEVDIISDFVLRYCGQGFGGCADDTCSANLLGSVRSAVIPFTLGVVTDGDEATLSDVGNKGFRLFFSQQPCA